MTDNTIEMTFGTLIVRQFPCLKDNYGFLLTDQVSGASVVIDTPEEAPIVEAIEANGGRLDAVWNTHWHPDHTGANEALSERYGCTIIGPRAEADKIPTLDLGVGEGDNVALGGLTARVVEMPGHTAGHIAYLFESERVGFVGDVLFSLGCGRLFEGTPAQMWASISKLKALDPAFTLYCAHEYTATNAKFVESLGEQNASLSKRLGEIAALRAKGKPTVPMTLSTELATNPFIRADDPDLAAVVGMAGAPAEEVFAEIRKRKDGFAG